MNESPPKVSICIAQYNRADALRGMIDSILSQDFDSFEVVIVNDGSTDPNTREVLDSYTDPRLRVIHKDNTGFVNSLRLAISSAKGDFIAIHGAGDTSRPDRIAKQAAVLENDPRVGIVGCLVETIVKGGPQHGVSWYDKPQSLNPDLNVLLSGKNPFTHGEVMFRRSLYDKVGGYREFFRFSQDRDLWIRMAEHCDMRIINEILYTRFQFYGDGISLDRRKVLLQQQLSDFAIQCHFDRNDFGVDFIEQYGVYAGLFKKRSARFDNYCLKRAIIFSLEEDSKTAEFYFKLSARNNSVASHILSLAIFILRKSQTIRALVKAYVRSRFNYDSLISGK